MKSGIIRATRSVYSAPGISFVPWLMMLPFSIFGTGAFVPEGGGGEPEWLAVGLLAHLVLLPIILISNLIAKAFGFRYGSILIVALFVLV